MMYGIKSLDLSSHVFRWQMLDKLGYELEFSPCNRFKDKVKRYIYKVSDSLHRPNAMLNLLSSSTTPRRQPRR